MAQANIMWIRGRPDFTIYIMILLLSQAHQNKHHTKYPLLIVGYAMLIIQTDNSFWFYHCLLQLYYCTTTAEVLHDFLKSGHLFVDMLPAKLYFIQTDFKVLIQGFKGF